MSARGAPALALPGLAERLRDWRDAVQASARFRRWAAGFPLTRPIARRRARAVFDLAAGFVYSQVLAASVELRLFALLAAGPLSADELAARRDLPPEAAARLLAAAAALRLVAPRDGGRFGLGPLGAALVDNKAVTEMVRHHAMLYADLADPLGLLRGDRSETRLRRFWAYARAGDPAALPEGAVADYSELMAASQPMVAAEVLDAYDVGRHRCLLDIGGGEGAFLCAAAERAPRLHGMLFDLPAVAARARARFAAAGLSGRMTAHGGDFTRDALPRGADLAALVRVVHDHDDATALAILRAARAALPPHGVLLLAEPMADAPGAGRVGDAYFGFYLLAMGQGRPRTAARLAALLREAGFARVRPARTRMPLIAGLLIADGH